jgi:hypothetical protein
LKAFTHLKGLFILPFMMHVWPEDFWKMMGNGFSVCKMPVPCRLESNSEPYLPSSSGTVYPLNMQNSGINSRNTSVMTSSMFLAGLIFQRHLKRRSMIMAFIFLIKSLVAETSPFEITHLCHCHKLTGERL